MPRRFAAPCKGGKRAPANCQSCVPICVVRTRASEGYCQNRTDTKKKKKKKKKKRKKKKKKKKKETEEDKKTKQTYSPSVKQEDE